MNAYEMKQQMRKERLERRAAALSVEGNAKLTESWEMIRQIPPGQPILVGHHSEKRHRRHLARSDAKMRAGFQRLTQARETALRAAAVGTGGISSDDPDSVVKLRQKLAGMEAERERRKAINAAYRKAKGADGWSNTLTPPLSDAEGQDIVRQFTFGWQKVPYPSYSLQNLGANIRRVAQRIADLERLHAQQAATPEPAEEQVGTATVTVDLPDNRVILRFAARLPRDQYKELRAYGWLWSPTRGGFVRKYSYGAQAQAVMLAQRFQDTAK